MLWGGRGALAVAGVTAVTAAGIAYIHNGQKLEREVSEIHYVFVLFAILASLIAPHDRPSVQNLHKGVIRDKELYRLKLLALQEQEREDSKKS